MKDIKNKWHKKINIVLQTIMILNISWQPFQRGLHAKGGLRVMFLQAWGSFSLLRNSPTWDSKTPVSFPLGISLELASLRSSKQLVQRFSPVTVAKESLASPLCRLLCAPSHPCRNTATFLLLLLLLLMFFKQPQMSYIEDRIKWYSLVKNIMMLKYNDFDLF